MGVRNKRTNNRDGSNQWKCNKRYSNECLEKKRVVLEAFQIYLDILENKVNVDIVIELYKVKKAIFDSKNK